MEIVQIEAFLVLAEELHFRRASERLYVSQPMVSRRIVALEREVGGALFERTSRRVRLTPLGEQLRARLQPIYIQLGDAISEVHAAATGVTGTLRLGYVATVPGEPLAALADAFAAAHPECALILREHPLTDESWDVWAPLRSGESDALLYFTAVDEPDLTVGTVIEWRDRVVLVAKTHRLAKRMSVSAEELASEQLARTPRALPASVMEMINPSHTPAGRPIPHTVEVHSIQESMSLIARGRLVLPTVAGLAPARRDDLVAVPLNGLPPLPIGLIWCRAHENAKIRALDQVARSLRRTASSAF